MSTYETQIEMALAGHCWEIEIAAEYHYEPEDRDNNIADNVEIGGICPADSVNQGAVDAIPGEAIAVLEAEILAGIMAAKVHRALYRKAIREGLEK